MRIAVYVLHTLALILQLAGAVLVVLDVRQSQRNTAAFKNRLDEAEEMKQNHIQLLAAQSRRSIPGPIGGRINLPTIPVQAHGLLADQLGPSGAAERKALTQFVQDQFAISKRRRWSGVGLLFAGAIIGYTANMLSVS
ncbi:MULTISPECIES: hypothetical protein [Rhodococcus]|uniref:hypothetical protein n=1 Tax=Rhodococcus TaxID=1827 RepID=UPI000C7DCB85|nr:MULTISPECIES: hypothetical protein [Rhodococcus]AUM16452.1 hypothetical protein CSW53_07895 [Rhodococcus ruber]